ncbi:MAG: hypothetical protein ACRDTJ_22855 [Pseudonocardiaceae bacterium]
MLPEQKDYEVWGWRGRTLSQPVTAPDSPAWLRIVSAPIGQIAATFWDGSLEAEKSLPGSIPRSRLRSWHDWSDQRWEYRAELYDRVAVRPLATSPALVRMPDLPQAWWAALRSVLDDLATVPARRVTVHQPFLDRAATTSNWPNPSTTVPLCY